MARAVCLYRKGAHLSTFHLTIFVSNTQVASRQLGERVLSVFFSLALCMLQIYIHLFPFLLLLLDIIYVWFFSLCAPLGFALSFSLSFSLPLFFFIWFVVFSLACSQLTSSACIGIHHTCKLENHTKIHNGANVVINTRAVRARHRQQYVQHLLHSGRAEKRNVKNSVFARFGFVVRLVSTRTFRFLFLILFGFFLSHFQKGKAKKIRQFIFGFPFHFVSMRLENSFVRG